MGAIAFLVNNPIGFFRPGRGRVTQPRSMIAPSREKQPRRAQSPALVRRFLECLPQRSTRRTSTRAVSSPQSAAHAPRSTQDEGDNRYSDGHWLTDRASEARASTSTSKILEHTEPPGYRQREPRGKPKKGLFLAGLRRSDAERREIVVEADLTGLAQNEAPPGFPAGLRISDISTNENAQPAAGACCAYPAKEHLPE